MSGRGLDGLRTELVAAAERQAAAGPRSAEAPRRRRWRWPRGAALLAVAVALGGGTATAITLVSSSAPDDPYDPAIPARTAAPGAARAVPLTRTDRERLRREREARAPRLDARRSFSVLARPASPRDRLPRASTGRPVAGKRPAGVRLAVQNAAGRVYVRATDREVCVSVFGSGPSGATSSCAPTVVARERGVFPWSQCHRDGPPQQRRFAGVVPDGVRAVVFLRRGVVQARAPVTTNGFAIVVDEPVDAVRVGQAEVRLPPVSC